MPPEAGPPRRLTRSALAVLAVLLLVAAGFLLTRRLSDQSDSIATSQRTTRPDAEQKHASVSSAVSDNDFLGSQQCASCHAEISAAYQSHPMANSISRVTGLPPGSENSSRLVPGKTRRYEVVLDGEQLFHKDEMFDADGKVIYSQAVRMDYIVGSGRRAFAYLYQQGDLLFQSPLNWYSLDAKWDLSPGYRPDDERRFRRRITDDCLSCHAGEVAAAGRGLNRYQQPAFSELSIGCERCHGPGKHHVEFHRSPGRHDLESDPVVNPARLAIAERESVCNQCHLQSAARILRDGHSEFDFRPGEKFEDIWSALDAGTDVSEDGRTRAVNHVQQMRDSRCYVASEHRLGCISCHDPHRLPAEQEKDAFYRTQCLNCHTDSSCSDPMPDRLAKNDSCIACHMPRRASNNISHITQTDHRVLRIPADTKSPDEMKSEESNSFQLRFFDDAHLRLAEWERSRALGVGVWSYLSKKGKQAPSQLEGLLKSSLSTHPDDGLVLSTLGALAMQQQRSVAARAWLKKAQSLPETEEAAVAGLLELSYQEADWARALEYVDRCLEIDPGHPGYHAIRADCLENSGRLSDAILAAEKSLELDPTRIPVREWLANAYEKDQRLPEAAAMREIVRRMQSAKVPE